ncbi:MAG: Asp-tRNA(Asn)/Glu-tRNA(Gln) amidotransferase subunit GatB [Clostridia bacterium]|nr:Asp-tRNA(Asn)/Glu-tRNA(Gln) amidotransferase subunit GatB [Clostridia bacterium]
MEQNRTISADVCAAERDGAAEYEAVIGLEVHVELKTGRKIFCSCRPKFGDEPNTAVCPVCLGMPGALPVLSDEAVSLAVRAGLALGCTINRVSWFDRKNYYYPDLPKGYQITQLERPVCVGGAVPIETRAGKREIPLLRIHMEEDAGKLIHRGDETLIDYNRAGVPLIEIVSEPELRTPEEAKAYLNSLRRILSYAGVSDCRMNEGSLRCDVNVSVRPRGSSEYGIKCEIKNVNSVNYVGRALEEEIARQTALLRAGEEVEAQTRRFNEDTGKTEKMRVKEAFIDYRYFTEPNLPAVELTDEWMRDVKDAMPPLPDEAARTLTERFGVKGENAALLTSSVFVTEYFTACAEACGSDAERAAMENLFVGELLEGIDPDAVGAVVPVSPSALAGAAGLFAEGKIVSGNAKRLVRLLAEAEDGTLTRGDAVLLAERENLLKLADPDALMPFVRDAVAASPRAVADYGRGKTAALKQILGQVMRATGGRADPILAEKMILGAVEDLNEK